MRPFLLFCFLACCSLTASAQLGVSGRVAFNEYKWAGGFNGLPDTEFTTGYEVALNYWFRLPKHRVEFLPSVYLNSSDNETRLNGGDVVKTGFADIYGVEFRTLVYLFDLAEDCDCPTFGKQGPQLQKGFFLEVAPGAALVDYQDRTEGALGQRIFPDKSRHNFTVNLGAGLDIGVSNFLTVTPHVNYRFGGRVLEDFQFADENGAPIGVASASLRTFTAGLRVALRFDAGRY